MIAPLTIEALADVARVLGFEMVPRDGVEAPIGIGYDTPAGQAEYGLLRAHEIEFDGTARECAAFLIGWRDLRSRVHGVIVESTVSAIERGVHYLTNTPGSQRQAATALGRVIADKVAQTLVEGEGPEKQASP